MENFLDHITFNDDGLVAAIAQQHDSSQVLMMAWMNEEAVKLTLETGQVHYFSRSRNGLWRKGESSGQTQTLKEFTIDCDGDTLLLKVDQKGVACHTGRRNCFYKTVKDGAVEINQQVVTSPEELYKN